MERHFEIKIEELKRRLVIMGGHVEKALAEVSLALTNRDASRFPHVHVIEEEINHEQISVDNASLELLAKLAPVAKDLRFIVSVLKINTDLERMGDQCVNIAHNGRELLQSSPINAFSDLPKMCEKVRKMVKESLDSFVRGDSAMAHKVILMDDEIDKLKNSAFDLMSDFIKANPEQVKPALNIILIARNLERLADHATNIAEDVIYAYTGKDIRHYAAKQTSS
jgi:phosphate transport system protein